MSFEGYYQVLCKNGHLYENDVYNTDLEEWKCWCGESVAWYNIVDQTNGVYDYDYETGEEDTCTRIDGYVELEIDKLEECEVCDKCGSRVVKKAATFKIPKEGVTCKKI